MRQLALAIQVFNSPKILDHTRRQKKKRIAKFSLWQQLLPREWFLRKSIARDHQSRSFDSRAEGTVGSEALSEVDKARLLNRQFDPYS